MDDGNEASRAVAPSTVDQLLAKRLPFFVLWFERWKHDCLANVGKANPGTKAHATRVKVQC